MFLSIFVREKRNSPAKLHFPCKENSQKFENVTWGFKKKVDYRSSKSRWLRRILILTEQNLRQNKIQVDEDCVSLCILLRFAASWTGPTDTSGVISLFF